MLHARAIPDGGDRPFRAADLPTSLAYALQPIVSMRTGVVHAYEALVRGTSEAGFDSIDGFFNDAHARNVLYGTELALFELALTTFRRLPPGPRRKIFLNIDSRSFADPTFSPADFAIVADRLGVSRHNLCLELSEKQAFPHAVSPASLVRAIRAEGVRIAVDDFGQGFSELKLLYDAAPEYVKIDRFFINDIQRAPRKRLFVTTIVNLAHVLGAKVIAEGVETAEEYEVCRSIGCDYAQGWHVAMPIRDVATAPLFYQHVALDAQQIRTDALPSPMEAALLRIAPLHATCTTREAVDRFEADPTLAVLPVVDESGEPLGILRERDLRAIGTDEGIRRFLVRTPVVDLAGGLERALDAVASVSRSEALIVTRDARYAGLLTSMALVDLMNAARLSCGTRNNGVTGLLGPDAISDVVERLGAEDETTRTICCFDLNHFKPFNDAYGYGRGDRALKLIADIVRRTFHRDRYHLGHPGADHFLVLTNEADPQDLRALAEHVLSSFRAEVESFYDPADRQRGYLITHDRNGIERSVPLMTASAAIINLPAGRKLESAEAVERLVVSELRKAKRLPGSLSSTVMG